MSEPVELKKPLKVPKNELKAPEVFTWPARLPKKEFSLPDVVALPADQIKPPPEMGTALNTDYLIGLGTIDQRMLILVDIDKLMSSAEIGIIDRIAA